MAGTRTVKITCYEREMSDLVQCALEAESGAAVAVEEQGSACVSSYAFS